MQAMAGKLQGSYSHVLVYEQQDVQEKARAVIPAEIQALSGKEQVLTTTYLQATTSPAPFG